MAYCTAADLIIAAGGEKRLRELADWDGNAVADSDVIIAAIAFADATIDGEIGKRYAVPLATEDVTTLIKNIAMDEAVYTIIRRRRQLKEDDVDNHAERMKQLSNIKLGISTMGTDPEPTKSSQVVDAQTSRDSDKATSRDAMKGFC